MVPHLAELMAELRGLLGDVQVEAGNPDDDQRDPAVWRSDLILCGFGPGAAVPDLFGFLGRVIREYGAWSYLPQVLVGEPADAGQLESLLRLGASLYLPGDTPPARVARKVADTLRGTWWQTEHQRAIPVLVVNRDGVIERANPSAARRFGPDPLLDRSYMEVVEGAAPGTPLPAAHPVRRAFTADDPDATRRWQSVTEVRESVRAGETERFYLTCNPLIVPARNLRATAVSLFDMTRWPRIIEAVDRFAAARDRAELLRLIVEQASRLGFPRVRLYEYDPADDQLHGRAAVGFRDHKKQIHFVTGFSIPADDPTTNRTLNEREAACLYIQGEGQPDKFTEYVTRDDSWDPDLEWEGVTRWIESPVFLPANTDGGPRAAWGKLCVDLGPGSDLLTARDVGDVAVFCSLVGHALAMQMRLERQEKRRQRLRNLSECMVGDMRPDEPVLDAYVKRSLQLILDETGGDAALYRRYDPQHPDALRLRGYPEFATPGLATRFAKLVPADIPRARATSGYFRHFAPGPARTRDVYVARVVAEEMSRFAAEIDPRHRPWLEFINTELHIPVFRGTDVVGVILVSSARADAFPDAIVAEVDPFVHVISLGIEAATRHDDWLLMGEAVRRVVGQLPRLAEVPLDRDDAFFAGLATMLSAHQGLRWNRVFVFSCQADAAPPNTAELVYALGGLAGAPPAPANRIGVESEHCKLQNKYRTDPRYRELDALVGARLADPDPHWVPPAGSAEGPVRDLLYETVIVRPRAAGQQIRVDTSPPQTVSDARSADSPTVEPVDPVRTLLALARATRDMELSPEYDPFPIPVNRDGFPNQWVQDMARQYPGSFGRTGTVYAFLLRSAADPERTPLGVVLVDMQSAYEVDEHDMIAATRICLRLASDILADRYRRRRQNGIINSLPARCHGPTLMFEWGLLSAGIKRLLAPPLGGLPAGAGLEAIEGLVNAHLARQNPATIRALLADLERFHTRLQRVEGGDVALAIPDLGQLLAGWKADYEKRNYQELRLSITWTARVDNLSVTCDPLVLKDAVGVLVDNTREEGNRLGRQLQASLTVDVVDTGARGIPRIVEFEYRDDGDGVRDGHRHRILIDGYTLADKPNGRGRGLSLLKRQLLEYRGCLECLDPAPEQTRGARFRIQIGLTTPEPAPVVASEEPTDVEIVGG